MVIKINYLSLYQEKQPIKFKVMNALVINPTNLQKRAEAVNSGRTDGTYFYVNGNLVVVSNPHFKMTEEQQISELEWFLNDREFEFSKN